MKFCLEYLMIVCRGQVSSCLVLLIYFLKTFVVDGLSSKNLISLIVLLLIRIIFIFVLNTNSYFIYLVYLLSMHFFFSPWAFRHNSWQFGIRNFSLSYFSLRNQYKTQGVFFFFFFLTFVFVYVTISIFGSKESWGKLM